MRLQVVALAAALVAAPTLSLGGPVTTYSQIFTFGDSLSDNGNAFIASGGTAPGPNYAVSPAGFGYYTDGSNTTPAVPAGGPQGLWIDQLAAKLGAPDPQPFLPPSGGTNYAVASGETGSSSPQDMTSVLDAFFLLKYGGHAPSTALYTLWGGANDINHALASGPAAAVAAGKTAADNIMSDILTLHANGAQYFLWLNLPPLGDTPGAQEFGAAVVAEANAASAAFNTEYALDVKTLLADGVIVTSLDIDTLFGDILANPSAYNFANVTDGCINDLPYVSMKPCSSTTNPNTYLFWDDEHPTTAGDALVADAAYDALAAPEPATYALMMLGGLGLIALRRSRRRAN